MISIEHHRDCPGDDVHDQKSKKILEWNIHKDKSNKENHNYWQSDVVEEGEKIESIFSSGEKFFFMG